MEPSSITASAASPVTKKNYVPKKIVGGPSAVAVSFVSIFAEITKENTA
jgi:hypothetical protein